MGFRPTSQWGIEAPFDVPDNAFMVLELVEKELDRIQGVVVYPEQFNEV
ncbi:MAG: hypothetical protein GY866_28860 [Proteobacteria bacterium]|nr:hypothetical protein [Pseudomonadota bacterium]